MKGYIIGPESGGEGVYTLVAEDGEGICSHFCSDRSYAMSDLYTDRPERKEMFDRKGIDEVLYIGDDSMTREELLDRNKKLHEVKE